MTPDAAIWTPNFRETLESSFSLGTMYRPALRGVCQEVIRGNGFASMCLSLRRFPTTNRFSARVGRSVVLWNRIELCSQLVPRLQRCGRPALRKLRKNPKQSEKRNMKLENGTLNRGIFCVRQIVRTLLPPNGPDRVDRSSMQIFVIRDGGATARWSPQSCWLTQRHL